MQRIAAWALEQPHENSWPQHRAAHRAAVRERIDAWLTSKGAEAGAAAGSFRPKDGHAGRFAIETFEDGDDSCQTIRLDEGPAGGRQVVTTISVADTQERLTVFITLEAGLEDSPLLPLDNLDPRCPLLVRSILNSEGVWYRGRSRLAPLRVMTGDTGGADLVAEIEWPDRDVPLLVVSKEGEHLAFPFLDSKLAEDLAGLANVVVIDRDASWALTDELGRVFSCFEGAVRVYWPQFSMRSDPFAHQLWTHARIANFQAPGTSPADARDSFRKFLRGKFFRAAAASVQPPPEIDRIRGAQRLHEIERLKAIAEASSDYETLARAYAEDNDRLRAQTVELLADLRGLQQANAGLRENHEAVLAAMREIQRAHRAETAETTSDAADAEPPPSQPAQGEVRFYKKVHSRPDRDVMIQVADCGCNRWESGHSGDKAKKGIKQLESGRDDWKAAWHCASCTGGGMWKVRW